MSEKLDKLLELYIPEKILPDAPMEMVRRFVYKHPECTYENDKRLVLYGRLGVQLLVH